MGAHYSGIRVQALFVPSRPREVVETVLDTTEVASECNSSNKSNKKVIKSVEFTMIQVAVY